MYRIDSLLLFFAPVGAVPAAAAAAGAPLQQIVRSKYQVSVFQVIIDAFYQRRRLLGPFIFCHSPEGLA